MSSAQVVETLYAVHRDKLTGALTFHAGQRTSQLFWHEGDVVGANVRFGHQSVAQALMAAGRLDAQMLDVLWARGEAGELSEDSLEEFATTVREAFELQLLANVKSLSNHSAETEFEPCNVEPMFDPVRGARLVRALFEAIPEPVPADSLFQCPDVSLCEPWILSDADREFLNRLSTFQSVEGATVSEVSLLRLLVREGLVTASTRVEPIALHEVASPPPVVDTSMEEATWVSQDPEVTPGIGTPLEFPAVNVAPMDDMSWGDMVGPQAPEESMQAARKRAQAELLKEMDEALRRSGSSTEDAWLTEAPPPVPELETIELSATEESPVASEEPPSTWTPSTEEATSPSLWGEPAKAAAPQPLRLNRASRLAADEDLWRILDGGGGDDGLSASFEEALQRVDANLERLVGLPQETLIEPVIEEATFEPLPSRDMEPGNAQNKVSAGPMSEDESWPWDEDDLAGDPSDPAEAARLRRQRLLRRAMQNLGGMPAPKAEASEAPAPIPAPIAEPAPAPAAAPASVEAARSPADAQLALTIERRFRDLQERKDHFTVLGVPRQVNADQVKAAFLTLAKGFHPDRLPPALASMSSQMNAVFEAIREAYEVLYDDNKRASYLKGLVELESRPVAAPSANKGAAEASELFKKGELLFRKREYIPADEMFTRAYELDPKAVYLAARGWSIYMDPARKADVARAKQCMTDALKADPQCDCAHYQLGVIARVEGETDKAERHFRDAVRTNPKHLEANQELRLIEMRKKNTGGKKGLFK